MSLKVSVFIATSVDGFIARTNGDLDWLDAANATVPAGEDCGYGALMQSVDALVMGRKTFEKVCSFGSWPYGETPVIVLSSAAIAIPSQFPKMVTHAADDPRSLVERLSRAGMTHIYLDGGNTVQRFLAAGLVDELTITVIPVLLGTGIPLFGPLAGDIDLVCAGVEKFDFGFVQLKYLRQ